MTASVPPGCRRRCASFKILCRPWLGASWKAYMTVTRSKDRDGSFVFSALALVKLVEQTAGCSVLLEKLWTRGLTNARCFDKNLAMDIISHEVSTPMTVSACGKALRRARVDIPTPQQRSTTRVALPVLICSDNSRAT